MWLKLPVFTVATPENNNTNLLFRVKIFLKAVYIGFKSLHAFGSD